MAGIVAGGTGFIGQYLIKRWLQQNKQITVVGRDKTKINRIFLGNVDSMTWAELREHGSEVMRHCDFVINLAGTNIGEHRWTTAQKKLLLQSRIETTGLIAKICATLGDKSPPLLNASAIGVYGLQETSANLPRALTEKTDLNVKQYPDLISKIGHDWEQSTEIAKAHGVRVVNLRFGVVLGQNGGALSQMLTPFKLGLGGPIGSGNQAFSWVHINDVANAIDFILKNDQLRGPVNIVAPHCVQQKQFACALGKALSRPTIMPMPGFAAKLLFGDELATELLLNGQNIYPKVLIDAGFEFDYGSVEDALKDIFVKKLVC